MGSIILLDEHTVNKIAAGEVVDRPSSIVKELVENSIDAGASLVSVEIKSGGIKYIKITDNGKGFASDDIEMAFERHATSKIRKEEDLHKITSMGFRGEALASIAAISKVNLVTKNKDENIGTKAIVEAGNILSVEPIAAITGTKIEIRDVFFNVPARFKFLKKDYTEAGYIEDVMIRIALANPQISIKYINNNKTIIQTSGNSDLRNTIFDIFGKDVYENVIPIDYEYEGIKITGMIGNSKISRSTRTRQYTYINSRYVKSKTITSAIDKAYTQKLAINKFAFCVINLKINPNNIDVNVHPAKLEVKFENEAQVFDSIYYALRTSIEQDNRKNSPFATIANEIKEETVENIENISKAIEKDGVINFQDNQTIQNNKLTKKFNFEMAENTNVPYISEKSEDIYALEKKVKQETQNQYELTNNEIPKEITENKVLNETKTIEDELKKEMTTSENISKIEKEDLMYRYVGQIFDTYIIIQIKEKMYIIDQHAAHERLLYEQIKQTYYSKDKESQLLLIPILVELTTKEKNIVEQNASMFERSGFIIEEFGDKAIKISGVPNIGYSIDYASMFKDIIDELLGALKTQTTQKEFRFLATIACKAAVKGKMKLNEQEQKALISDMVKLENPFTCPHGRPTAYEISKYEIERRFLRK
ncbi:MAG: DNA mismatch repair endonuclease MutL [Clostridia bacterium]